MTAAENKANTGANAGGAGKPILFDLDNNGFAVTTLDDSSFFFDIGGDGYKHRTAWVGAGDGVLVIDADGDGKISSRKEVVLTEWDPSADSDMEALRQVFDTNNNGLLDAGDAKWSQFKIAVTKADGTTEMKTLAELGIQSLTLVADETRYEFADGSSIDGEAVFTRTNGTQGKAATATLSFDAAGFAVTQTDVTNAASERVVTATALAADGSVASQTVRTTSADGRTITTRFDNDGDGVVDRILSDVTIDLAGGAKQRTEVSRTGAGVLMTTTVTTTNADRSLIQIDRDQLGGGFVTESETQQRGANNSLVITVADKAANGTVISSKQTEFSGDRLTRTDRMDADGNLAYERALTSQTIHNAGGSLTKRDSVNAGDGTLLSRTVTEISANGLVRSETVDSDGDLAIDRNISSVTTRNATTGTSQIVEQVKARDLSLITSSTTTVSADGLSKTIVSDIDGNGTNDRTSSDVTVIAADQSRTQTVEVRSGNGTLLSRAVTTRAVDGLTGSKNVDADGDGVVDQTSTVVRNASGQTIETSSQFSANGVMLARSVATTSVDGLSTTRQVDSFGLGSFDAVTTDVVVRNADGSAQQTLERLSGNNTLLEKVITSKSADGLLIQSQRDITGDGVADSRGRDQTTVNADGSQVRTVETRSGSDAVLLSKETTNTSSDRRTVVRTVDIDGDGQINQRQTSTTALDGSKTVVDEVLTDTGMLASKTTVTTSANGLTQTSQVDLDGNATIDARKTVATVLAMDGSQTVTTSELSGNQTLLRREIVTQSGNGMLTTTTRDLNSDGVADETAIRQTVINANGSTTVTVTGKAGTTTNRMETTTASGNGLSTTVSTDADGNGTIDQVTTTTKQMAVDGDMTETQEVRSRNGALVSRQTVVTEADGKNASLTLDRNGDGVTDLTRVTQLQTDGSVVTTTTELGAGAAVKSRVVETTSRNGLVVTQAIDRNGDGTVDKTRVAEKSVQANGSVINTLTEYNGTSTSPIAERTVITTSGNGLTETTVWSDASGTTRSREVVTTLAQNGTATTVTTYRKANGSLESVETVTKSGDGNSTVLTVDVDGNGVIDTRITTTIGNDGVKTVLSEKLGTGGTVLARKTETISANGLVVTTTFDGNGDGTAEIRVTSVTEPLADGSMRTTITREALVSGVWQLKGREVSVAAGNQLSSTSQWDDKGAGSYGLSRSTATVLNADGSRKTTDTVTQNGAAIRIEDATVSANGTTVTQRIDVDGNGTFDQIATVTTVLNADGSTTTTQTNTKSDGTVLSSRVTTLSADGLTTTTQETSSLADWPARTRTESTRMLADGGKVITVETRLPSNGQLMEKSMTTTSADERVITTEIDNNGDGIVDQRKTQTRYADGRVSLVETGYSATGAVISRMTSTTSADGRQTIIETDRNGDGVVDLRKTINRDVFGDGSSSTITLLVNAVTGATKSRTQETVSADGMLRVETTDVNNDGVADQTVREEALPSGIRKITVTNNAAARASSEIRSGEIYWNDTIPYTIETTVSLDGKTRTIRMDNDGDGRLELTAVATTQIDGSVTTILTETRADGSIKARGTMTQSHDQRVTILTADTDNNGSNDWTVTTTSKIDGTVEKVATKRNAAGALTETKKTWIDSLGNIRSSETRDGSNRLTETYTRASDFTGTRTRYEVTNGAVSSVETLSDDDKLQSVMLYDALNAQTWNRVEQIYDAAGNKTNENQYLDDGQQVRLVYDTNNLYDWSYYVSNYYANGVFYSHRGYHDTGRSQSNTIDPLNLHSWSEYRGFWNESGQLYFDQVWWDDGNRREINYNPSNTNERVEHHYDDMNYYSWRLYMEYYNSNGFNYRDMWWNDDNSYVIVDYPGWGDWARNYESYDVYGRLNYRVINKTDGSYEVFSYDVGGNYNWSIYHEFYNGNNFKYKDILWADDNSYVSTDYPGWGDWIYNAEYYDNYGRRYERLISKTDGTYEHFRYDYTGQYEWSMVFTIYSSGWNILHVETHFDAGFVYFGNYANPVVLDLDNSGSVSLNPLVIEAQEQPFGQSPKFDWDGDGVADKTAWVGATDGLLVIDLAADGSSGADGKIDQAREVAFALWPDDAAANPVTDLEGLRLVFDSNHDNVLDDADLRWNEFRVWQDLNQNGTSEAGELKTMSEAGIKLLNLLPSTEGAMAFSDGSIISGTSTYETTDGLIRLVADASFRYIHSKAEAIV